MSYCFVPQFFDFQVVDFSLLPNLSRVSVFGDVNAVVDVARFCFHPARVPRAPQYALLSAPPACSAETLHPASHDSPSSQVRGDDSLALSPRKSPTASLPCTSDCLPRSPLRPLTISCAGHSRTAQVEETGKRRERRRWRSRCILSPRERAYNRRADSR